MKRKYLIGKILLAGLFVAGISQSCTNLDEQLYDQVTPETFLKGQDQFVSALGTTYSSLGGYASGDIFELQEVSTDEMVVPTRGSDWDDGGTHRRIFEHNLNTEDPAVNGAWGFCYTGINNCNRNIELFNSLVTSGQVAADLAASYIAELKVLREFFYFQALNLYGNIPIVTSFSDAPAQPPTVQEPDVYTFIEQSLKDNVPLLTKDKGGSGYGRMNYWAGKMLQAKLYMNAEVYTGGTAHWQDCADACTDIIDNGGFELTSDFFSNFSAANTGTTEMIFAIPYDQVFFKGFNLDMQTLHYGSQFTYNLTSQPWNGFCTLEEFYNSFEANDLRRGDPGTLDGPAKFKGSFLAGFQYNSDGTPVMDNGFEATDEDGEQVNFTPNISEIGPNTLRQAGARIGKWEFANGATSDMSNDFAVFRYSDVLLMQAEALWRLDGKNSTNGTALALVNQVRARAGVDPLATLDGPISFDLAAGSVSGGELFNERGRELFSEHSRRQDLVRWGLFTAKDNVSGILKWGLKTNFAGDQYNTASFTTLLPIPKNQTDANKKLVQNPGY